MMAQQPKQHGLARKAAMQITAGGSAGFVEVCLMHPLDLIKTRFQVQRGPDDPHRYKSLADCFRKIYRTEGLISFYKGILPPILAETPKRAVKFFTFEQYKALFLFGADSPTAVTFTLAGLCAGLTEAVVINPFEVVKVKLQTDMAQTLRQQKPAFAIAKEIVKTDGFGKHGLNKGLTSTLGRHGVFNMIYFGFYHNVKAYFPPMKVLPSVWRIEVVEGLPHVTLPKDPSLDLVRRFVIGFCGGTLASCINIPFDVAKSRIQGPQPTPGHIKYRGCFQSIALVYKEEGFFALYKGLLPKIMRLGPGGAIMLIVFDFVYEHLQKL